MNKKQRRLAQTTLPQSLGELELTVMNHVWENGETDAKYLAGKIQEERLCSLSTVQTTLERLVKKNLLQRHKQGYAYHYSALASRGEFMGRMMKDVVSLLHDGKSSTILSSFVNVAATLEDAALDELEQLIRDKRRQKTRVDKV